MSFNYTLKYRTFDQLMAEVYLDFTKYDIESLISPEQLLKVVKRVNYDLGLRIMMTKEDILDVEKGRVKLPDNFYTLNYGLICDETEVTVSAPQGTFIDERLITPYQETPATIDSCAAPEIACRTSVNGCSCGCSDSCGCTGDCNSLCPQCSAENTLCNSTTTTIVSQPGADTRSTIYNCMWMMTDDQAALMESFTIIIDGALYTINPGNISGLNALGLGDFDLHFNSGDGNYYLFCLGTHIYGEIIIYDNHEQLIGTLTHECETIITYTGDTTVCGWAIGKKQFEGTTSWDITIDGTSYPISGLMTLALVQLNALGLGVFTTHVYPDDLIIITVTGTHTYGVFNYGLVKPTAMEQVCSPITVTAGPVTTTTTIEKDCYANPPTCKPRVILDCKDNAYELVQIVNPAMTYTYRRLLPLKILPNPQSIECGCPNLYVDVTNTAWIKDGYLYTNFSIGKVYINYQGTLEDEDHNLMVPDHDGLNDYYEYAIKSRILENLIMNDEIPGKKIELIENRLRTAKLYAHTVVNTPNFSEMKELWLANRRAQYSKYYDMFKSYSWNQI